MIINAMCTVDDYVYSAGYDGIVKKWQISEKGAAIVEEISTGKCINTMVAGLDDTVYVGDSDGFVKRVTFAPPPLEE